MRNGGNEVTGGLVGGERKGRKTVRKEQKTGGRDGRQEERKRKVKGNKWVERKENMKGGIGEE